MLKNDMAILTRKLYNDLREMEDLHEKILANNLELIQGIDIEDKKVRKKIIAVIKESSEPSIAFIADLMAINLKTADSAKVIKFLIQKPLPELGNEELYILRHTVKHIDAKPLLTSKSDEISILGRVINYLQGNDAHKQIILSEIADSYSFMNLYHAAKHAETTTEPKRDRAATLDSKRASSPRSPLTLSRTGLRFSSTSALSPRTPRTPRVEDIFEQSSPSLHRKLEDIKLGSSPSPKTKHKK
jgi:hypothetical protein